ncbi:ComF family protein [Undibacterium sp. CY18W]|uniref:ComF family protein n=1 Tax=Undibacterium hunanense TaxID=2762292 RepID=A0ABR6ZRJ6_9BURK|nr:phosphoribosyltransferase family protein [Undibacterium hunanense]MBC3918522.1 ComF family protein [Undibacterium hunanense]
MQGLPGALLHHLKNSLSALLPGSCALCRQAASITDMAVCAACRYAYFARQQERCLQCALPLPANAVSPRCGDCLRNPPAFDMTVAVCDYAAPQDQLVLALKFGHELALAPWFALMLRDSILRRPAFELPHYLCAVPLGTQRLAERGFNQALEIARPLSRQLGVPLHTGLLHRSRETARQSSLPIDARARNIRQAFSLDEHELHAVKDLHIGIIDDVMTTGMTMHEIATMLKRYGAAKVSTYVFARTPPHL